MALDPTTFAVSAMNNLSDEEAKGMLTALVAKAAGDPSKKATLEVRLPPTTELGGISEPEVGAEFCLGATVCVPFLGCHCVGVSI